MSDNGIFWSLALVWMAAMVAVAVSGWRAVRAGDIDRHRSRMNIASLMIGVFLAAYVFKVLLLGKEDLSLWSRFDILTLRVHETFVAIMVLAGVGARILARRFMGPSALSRARQLRLRLLHRRAGIVAQVAAILGLATAVAVWLVILGLERLS